MNEAKKRKQNQKRKTTERARKKSRNKQQICQKAEEISREKEDSGFRQLDHGGHAAPAGALDAVGPETVQTAGGAVGAQGDMGRV